MSQTSPERRHFPVPMSWPYAGSDPSRPGHYARRTVRSLIRFRALAEMPIPRFQSRLCADPPAASCRRHIQHRDRRRHQIPIAPVAPPVPNFPRLRALALFRRRPPQSVVP